MVTHVEVRELLRVFTELGEQVSRQTTSSDAFAGVTKVAVSRIEGTAFASITRKRTDHFQTFAPTSDLATAADRLQYELMSGPCIDSVNASGLFSSDDMGDDARWPVFGPQVADRFGVTSMLSVRMVVDTNVLASVNMYSHERAAFPLPAQTLATLLAVHAGVILGGVLARERVEHMEVALAGSRRIGMAVGVLMAAQRITAEQAFDLLRIASQRANRRVALIAEQVLETGELDIDHR